MNISSTTTELFSELFNDQKSLTSYKVWHGKFYSFSKSLKMIGSDAYMHFENKKLKKTDKLSTCFKKMILIEYRNHSIYCLYNRESNLIFILCSVDVNENSILKKITAAEVYKIEFSTAESINSFTDSFIKSFINFSSQIDK